MLKFWQQTAVRNLIFLLFIEVDLLAVAETALTSFTHPRAGRKHNLTIPEVMFFFLKQHKHFISLKYFKRYCQRFYRVFHKYIFCPCIFSGYFSKSLYISGKHYLNIFESPKGKALLLGTAMSRVCICRNLLPQFHFLRLQV